MIKLRVFTAFSGYDSQCMALDRLKENYPQFDYELVGWSEIDKYAIMAHNAVYPQWRDRNFGDITTINWKDVPDFDLFTYSSPCQDFSIAGKLAGGAEGSGTRSSLLWECRKAITIKKPKYLLMENVKNLTSKRYIELFKSWCDELESYGYTNYWSILDSQNYGVPQHRERVFLVSILDSDHDFVFPQSQSEKVTIGKIIENDVDEKYYISEKLYDYFVRTTIDTSHNHKLKPLTCDDVSFTLQTINGRVDGNYLLEPIVLGWSRNRQGMVTNWHAVDVANCLTANKRYNTQNYILVPANNKIGFQKLYIGGCVDISYPNSKTRRGRVQCDVYISPALTTNCGTNIAYISNVYRLRSFTERECFRLMGVSDENIEKIRAIVSKTQCYKLAGNSIVVDVLYYIFTQLFITNNNYQYGK